MELSVFDIVGNGVSNQEISNTIIQKLKNKYNEEFCVKMIGNRYGTAANDSITAYCFSKKNEKMLFTAILNKDETILEDDFYLRKVSYMLQDTFESKFRKKDIDIIIKIKIIGVNFLKNEMSVESFVENYKKSIFLAKFICSKEIDEETLKEIFLQVGNEYKNINVKSAVYFIDVEDFEKLKKVAQKIPDINVSIIEKYNIKEEKMLQISEGNVIIIK